MEQRKTRWILRTGRHATRGAADHAAARAAREGGVVRGTSPTLSGVDGAGGSPGAVVRMTGALTESVVPGTKRAHVRKIRHYPFGSGGGWFAASPAPDESGVTPVPKAGLGPAGARRQRSRRRTTLMPGASSRRPRHQSPIASRGSTRGEDGDAGPAVGAFEHPGHDRAHRAAEEDRRHEDGVDPGARVGRQRVDVALAEDLVALHGQVEQHPGRGQGDDAVLAEPRDDERGHATGSVPPAVPAGHVRGRRDGRPEVPPLRRPRRPGRTRRSRRWLRPCRSTSSYAIVVQ